ncbi:hypothetical protein Pla110_43990 [Polystyrenella longa]|uniref:Uncharacterized protein n=1 Tax=Polystyrenella longa TaxID=2528007 RepID=A0A518CTW4_9PLAN|nr:hypothetical protein [Polystyrenella longa]QDU82638.1 hypothetical protein Pla110_43990 [Polystyrenella longa]
MASKNILTHGDLLKAGNHVAQNIPAIEEMKNYRDLSEFLTEKMDREISVNNAKSILAAVQESGVEIHAFGQQKPGETASDEMMRELIKSNQNLMKSNYALMDTLKKLFPQPAPKQVNAEEYAAFLNGEPKEPGVLPGILTTSDPCVS